MDCLKGTMLGLVIGMVAGVMIGATNCQMVHDVIKQGKKEVKRFKKKMNLI